MDSSLNIASGIVSEGVSGLDSLKEFSEQIEGFVGIGMDDILDLDKIVNANVDTLGSAAVADCWSGGSTSSSI